MPARSTLLTSMLLSILLIGCNSSEYSGSYAFPTAIIGIETASRDEETKLERQVTTFAVAKKLDVYPPSSRDPIADPMQQPLSDDTLEYAPYPPDLTYGFSMALQKLAEGCFIVQFSERSQSWTPQSLASLAELQHRLTRAACRARCTGSCVPNPSKTGPRDNV